MAPPTDASELQFAWRALASESASGGWRTIQIRHPGPCTVLAARHFPGNEESLLVGFGGVGRPSPDSLPAGRGFDVTCPDLGVSSAGRTWIALSRRTGAPLDLFIMMATDVLSAASAPVAVGDAQRFLAFLQRIRAWQEFMRRGPSLLLDPDEEVGLAGELEVLQALLAVGASPDGAVNSWRGPCHGLHDFVLGRGAVEVKSTTTVGSFPAKILSLEQLDDAAVSPLFLAAVRFVICDGGLTLAERVDAIRAILAIDPQSATIFESRLVEAGYLEAVRERYVRRFQTVGIRTLHVCGDFPRLTASNVPAAVRRAKYELDLSLVDRPDNGIDAAFLELGVTN